MRDVAPTRSAALALVEERQLMRQGFGFLDEKRMLLASEMLKRLRDYAGLSRNLDMLRETAARALAAAVERHGLDALQHYPATAEAPTLPKTGTERFLGVPLRSGEPWRIADCEPAAAIDPSEEVEACRTAFARWLEAILRAGLLAESLERLAFEYRRVERRAKALENVLLPEVEATLKQVREQLDLLDQEEVVRVRTAARSS